MKLLAAGARPTPARCTPRSSREEPGRCPSCGMKLLPAQLVAQAAAMSTTTTTSHGHATTRHEHAPRPRPRATTTPTAGGIEWEDDMVEVNRITTPANTRWKLDRPLHRRREPRHRVAVHGRRPGEDPPGQRDGLRPPDAPPVPHPRRGPLPGPRPRRRSRAQPGLERHRAGAHRRDRRHPARRHQPGRWMAHCHIAEHHESGMMFSFDVAPAERRRRCHDRAAATSSSSAAARPAWPSATSWPSRAAASPSWRPPASRPPPGAPAGTRCGCSRRCATTACPGRAFPGEPDSYPGRDEVVAYLTDYARHFELPVELEQPRAGRPRRATARLRGRARRPHATTADQVVVATGPFQVPFTPAIADRPRARGRAAAQHRVPPARRSCRTARRSWSAAGTPATRSPRSSRARARSTSRSAPRQTPLPQRILGRDLFRYLEATGLMRKTVDSRLGAAAEGPRDADRLQPPRARASRASACGRARPAPQGSTRDVRRRQPSRRRAR